MEQKQVDIHIAVDLLTLASVATKNLHVAVVSDDWDLLPAMLCASRTVAELGGLQLVRMRSEGAYLDAELRRLGIVITEASEDFV